eukprot:gnl/MRDRNA2_/MRDRNA2_89916_c0_seq1.p1 gnl/MRDRNA2_/MRDRNA2_89916_c0~~gnl/MRDRNA2_/MRDRNA2_89916_c0_seq1.p1  ORF type:complete len:253 (+),score=72.21 gnl/MRDRNA2_/MRDRNA2_89916_c0_seq1:126-884(+)
MQAALLHEPMPSGSKMRMFVSLISMLIGLYVGFVTLSPMHEPATNMLMAFFQPNAVAPRARNAPTWPVARPNLRGLHNTASFKAIHRPVVALAKSEVLAQLEDAIKDARECTKSGTHEECLVAWDTVEELSAAVAHSKPVLEKSKEVMQLEEQDMKTFKTIMEGFAAAREKVPKEATERGQIDPKAMEAIAAALAEKQQAITNFGSERLEKLEAKIQKAKEEAKASGSAVDWDIVEELMQERSHLTKFGGSN